MKLNTVKTTKKLADGSVPAYGSGGLMRYVDRSIHDKKSVLIPRKGTLSNLFLVEPPFWTVDTLFWTDIDTKNPSCFSVLSALYHGSCQPKYRNSGAEFDHCVVKRAGNYASEYGSTGENRFCSCGNGC